MAHIQNTSSDQAGGGSAGGTPGAGTLAADAGGDAGNVSRARRVDPAGTTAGHTTPGGGTGADLTDVLTDGDGLYDGDADMSTGGVEIIDPNKDAAAG